MPDRRSCLVRAAWRLHTPAQPACFVGRGSVRGGYAAFVFDKYSGELVEKLRSSLDDAVAASSMQAVRGTQTAKWNGRTILLQFDVTYRHSEYGTVTKSVLFTGHRVWFDTYDWSEPV